MVRSLIYLDSCLIRDGYRRLFDNNISKHQGKNKIIFVYPRFLGMKFKKDHQLIDLNNFLDLSSRLFLRISMVAWV
jgi:hypothetical protein